MQSDAMLITDGEGTTRLLPHERTHTHTYTIHANAVALNLTINVLLFTIVKC